MNKFQEGGVTPQDNTRVRSITLERLKFTPQQLKEIKDREIQKQIQKNRSYIYDAQKAKYYQNLQDFYNTNFFGHGLFGEQTRYDPTTQQGQEAIQSTFNYSKDNAYNFLENIVIPSIASGVGTLGKNASKAYTRLFKGVFQSPSKNGALGTLKQYTKNPIGRGSEAIVINNTPTTVGKITSIPVKEMQARNQIPNTVQSQYVGYVKDKGTKLPTYVQKKVKVLTDKTFPKYANKLDRAMERSGFRRVNDPNVQYRAYTNGQVVVDDVAPGNVGLDWLRRPKMIDFNMQTVPEWTAQGFTLKKGGKL